MVKKHSTCWDIYVKKVGFGGEYHDFYFHSKSTFYIARWLKVTKERYFRLYLVLLLQFWAIKTSLVMRSFFVHWKLHTFCHKFFEKGFENVEKNSLTPLPTGMLRLSWDNLIIVQRRQLVYLDLGKNNWGHTYHRFF